MKRFLRSGLALLLTVAMLVGPASTALADKGGNGRGRSSRFSSQFNDWQSGFWANESLARMIIKGVMKGGTNGTGLQVDANRPVTRLEAAIMLVRLLGLDQTQPTDIDYQPIDRSDDDDEDRYDNPLGLKFKLEAKNGKIEYKFEFEDDEDIPLWGRDAVAVALEKGFLVFDGRSFNPMAPLKRVEAAIMLVKAAGLDAEAQSRAGAALPFVDAPAISYMAKGYVAVALEKGFINGNPDGTFQPNKPVTRAQWAAMLDRLDRGQSADQRQVKGTITAINQSGTALPTISMTTPVFPNGVTYTVADQAVFFVGGQEATINDLHVGDQVLVQLSDTRQILMVTTVGQTNPVLTGTVVAFTAPSGTQNGTIILQGSSGAGQAYAVAPTAVVRLGALPGTFADVQVGDRVTLTVTNGVVTTIAVNVSTQKVQGTVTAKTTGSGSTPNTLTVRTSAGAATTYALAANATIVSAAGANLTFVDIKVGDSVELQVQRSLAVSVKVLQSTSVQTVTGSLVGLTIGSSATPSSLTVSTSAGTQAYTIAANASITYNGQAVTLGDLRIGDSVTLTVTGGVVTSIVIGQRQSQTVSLTGDVSSLNRLNQTFTLTVSGTNYTVGYNDLTAFTYQGQAATAASLQNGQTVKVTGSLVASTLLATKIEIQVAQSSVSGTVAALTNNSGTTPDVLVLNTGSATAMYQVNANVAVSWNGLSLTFADLVVGDQVTLTLTNGVVSAISITGRTTQAVSLSGQVSGLSAANKSFTLTLAGTSGNTAYTVGWNAQTVFTYQGLNVTSSQLANGQQVTVTGTAAGSLVTASKVDIQVNQANLAGSVVAFTVPTAS
ncbi:MAG: S-layer homology domain-containing protein, partial [Bacillota bacterium]